jgi:hypothetical protein
VRQQAGQATDFWLFEGEALIAADVTLATENAFYAGQILSALCKDDGDAHDGFITDDSVPVGDTLRGSWMIVTHGNGFRHGYQIDRVEKQDGKTVILLASDHGLRIDGKQTEEVFFPQRMIQGKNTFVIPLAAAMPNP